MLYTNPIWILGEMVKNSSLVFFWIQNPPTINIFIVSANHLKTLQIIKKTHKINPENPYLPRHGSLKAHQWYFFHKNKHINTKFNFFILEICLIDHFLSPSMTFSLFKKIKN